MSISSLDEARRLNPELGFALYAYEPGGPITLEIHDPVGEVFTFAGITEEAVFAAAFPADAFDDVSVVDDDRHENEPDIFD
jgi:hypothetical protein